MRHKLCRSFHPWFPGVKHRSTTAQYFAGWWVVCFWHCLPTIYIYIYVYVYVVGWQCQRHSTHHTHEILGCCTPVASRPVACVICVQETWLSEMSDYPLVAIDGYNCIHQSKRAECSNHGGLITYVDKQRFLTPGHQGWMTCTVYVALVWNIIVKLEELHIATARKPLFHQTQPVACYQHRNQPCMW